MKKFFHSLFFNSVKYSGMNLAGRWARRDRLLVLCYHGVADNIAGKNDFRYNTTVSVKDFHNHLAIVKKKFHPISAKNLIDHIYGKTPLPPRPVLVTFDDGLKNNLIHAAPLLKKFEIPAIFHVTTGYINNSKIFWSHELVELILNWQSDFIPVPDNIDHKLPNSLKEKNQLITIIINKCKEIPDHKRKAYIDLLKSKTSQNHINARKTLCQFMTWDEVRELNAMGFTIGSHTVNHPILTKIDKRTMANELKNSKEKIESELGIECNNLAYPNGGIDDFSIDIMKTAKQTGYKLAFAVTEKINSIPLDEFAIRRYAIGNNPVYDFHSRISGTYNLVKG